ATPAAEMTTAEITTAVVRRRSTSGSRRASTLAPCRSGRVSWIRCTAPRLRPDGRSTPTTLGTDARRQTFGPARGFLARPPLGSISECVPCGDDRCSQGDHDQARLPDPELHPPRRGP